MRIPEEILKRAWEIGFSYHKEPSWPRASVSLPCQVTLHSGECFEMAELLLVERLRQPSKFISFEIEEVGEIKDSPFALPLKFRRASTQASEYRGDRPFFLSTQNGTILGYNAISMVNLTYRKDFLGSEITGIVDFETAQREGFEMVEGHSKKSVKILCGHPLSLVKEIARREGQRERYLGG